MTTITRRLLVIASLIVFGVMLVLAVQQSPRTAKSSDTTQLAPSSSLIAFTSHRDGHAQIYILDLLSTLNGSPTFVNISHTSSNDSQPTWSSDGKSIAYVSDRDGNTEICAMDSDGQNQRCLTNHKTANKKPDKTQESDSSPLWSPDGLHIAYVATLKGRTQIWVMDSDGSNAVNLSNNSTNNDQPAWSPDLKQIAYVSNRNGNYALCVMDGSGFNQHCITNNPTTNRRPDPKRPEDTYPVWSPDSQTLAYSSTRTQNRDSDIYLINADGSGDAIDLTQNIGIDTQPTWSPDAKNIVFVSNRGGTNQLWEMNADGSNQVDLTDGKGNGGDTFPAWQPAPPNPNATPTQTLTPTPPVTRTPEAIIGNSILTGTAATLKPTSTKVLSPTPGNSPNISVSISDNIGFVGQDTNWTVFGGGGAAPYTFALIGGSFPPGMNLIGSQLFGVPTTPGSYNFTLSATDKNGFGGNRSFAVSIFQQLALPDARVNVPYSSPVVAGGLPPYTATLVVPGSLPSGLNLASDGTISGTPLDVATSYTFSINILDTNGIQFTAPYTLIVQPGAATHLTVAGYASPTIAGQANPFTVTALDIVNNVATGYVGTVHFTSSDTNAPFTALPADYTFTGADAGVHTFSGKLTKVGTQSITATDTATSIITGMQGGIVVTPAGASIFTVVGFPSPSTAGVSGNFTVTALDAFGNTATGYAGTVTFTSSDAQAVLPTNSTLTAGVGTFSATLKTASLNQSITATDTVTPGITGKQTGIQVTPAGATIFTVTGYPSPTTAGISGNFTVTALDAFGNTATGYAGTAHFTIAPVDPLATLPADSTLTAGVGTFPLTFRTVGTYSITATDTVTPSITGQQTGIQVNPAGASIFTVVGFPSPTTAGISGNFTVTALDSFGNTATGYAGTVKFTSSDAQAVLPANSTLTAGVGTFSATLKTASLNQSITATDTVTLGITGKQTGIQVTPAGATIFTVTGYPSPSTAGISGNFTVTALDSFGNTATGYAGTAHFTIAPVDPLATLPADSTLTAGAGTFPLTFRTVGVYSITAMDTVTSSITGQQTGIQVTPAAATKITLTGYPLSTTAGVPHTFTVTAFDPFNNVATGYVGTVTFTSTDGGAVLPSPYTFIAGDAGIHTFAATLTTVGTQSITVTDSAALTDTESGIVVTSSAATHFSLAYPASVTAGNPGTLVVTALDAFNNTAATYTGTVAFTSNDPQAVLPGNYTFVAGDAGTHTFGGVVTLKSAGIKSITATDTVTSSITGSKTVSVNPAATSLLLVAAFPLAPAGTTTAGVAGDVKVTAQDLFGNTTPAYSGTIHFTSSDLNVSVVLPGNYTFLAGDNGVHTFINGAKLITAPSQSITATDTVSAGITGNQTITVHPAAATQIALTGYPLSTTAGISHTFTVTAFDPFNNVATGYVGTVTFTSTDGGATLPTPYTFVAGDAGIHTFSATLTTGGTQSITATDSAALTDTESGIVVTSSAATHFSLAYPASVTAGNPGTLVVTALDAFNNTAATYTGTVAFTSNDPQAVLPGNYTFVAADAGTHTFASGVTLKTAGTKSITATDTSAPGVTGSKTVTVNPAGTSKIKVAGYPSPTVAGAPHNFTVTAQDPFNNVTPGYVGTVTFTSSDGGATLPTPYTFTAGDAGIHTFSATLATVGTQSITATDGGALTDTEGGITVTSSAATHFTVTYPTGPMPAGTAGALTVTAVDAFNNTATTYTGTVAFSSSDAQAVLPGNYTFLAGDNGSHTFLGVILKTAGLQTIIAKDTLTPAITGTQAGIQIVPAAAFNFVVSGFPVSIASGTAGTVTVTAKDQFGNIATGYAGTVHFTSSDLAAVLPANYTFVAGDNGSHTFTNGVTLNTAGTQSITATDTFTSSITGSETGIVVS